MGTCPRSNEKIKLFQSLLSKKYHHFWFLVKKVKLKYVSVYLCIYVSTYVCVYVFMDVCMYICMYVCIYVYLHGGMYGSQQVSIFNVKMLIIIQMPIIICKSHLEIS